MIALADKKRYVKWVIQHVSFKKRETFWILNYLLNHDAMLKHAVFVQSALSTPRGILMSDQASPGLGLEMIKEQTIIQEPDQIFHDIRQNRKSPLYIEIQFQGMHANDLYLSVLEENPYQPLSQEFQEEFDKALLAFAKDQEKEFLKERLKKKIDLALEVEDQETFEVLSKKYINLLKEEKKP